MRLTRASSGASAIQLLMVALVAAAVLGFVQHSVAGLYGYDSPYHMRYSQLLGHDLLTGRGFSHTFPWWQETFLKDHWADKDLLYHLLLIPFTWGDLDVGGKLASIFFGTMLYVCIFLALRWMGAPAPALWTIACLLSSTTLLFRAGLVRSHVVAIALAALGAAAIVRGRPAGIFLTSAAYALAHIGWHLLPGIALVHDAARGLTLGRFRPRAAAWSAAGAAAAVVVNPYFPDNLRLWYVQNVDVLIMAWLPSSPDLSLGTEFLPGRPLLLAYNNLGPLLFTLGGAALLILSRGRGTEGEEEAAPVALGLVTLGLLCLSLLSRRFAEFWAPFATMFAAMAAARYLRRRGIPPAATRLRSGVALGAIFALLGLYNVSNAERVIGEDPGKVFDTCATWIRDNVPAGETIFTTEWDVFPDLFFTAPRQNYLVGLDPTFMYVTSPERWRLWREVVEGRARDVHETIASQFKCRYLFADASHERFIERAEQDPWLRREVRDADCGVYSVREPLAGSERPLVGTWRLEGGRSIEIGARDFIDVERMTAGPPRRCARLHGMIEAPGPSTLSLAISTDDRVTVELNGRMVFDSASAEPLSLGDVLERQRADTLHIYERSFIAEVRAGYNDVTVSTCREGNAWGFFLRVSEEP